MEFEHGLRDSMGGVAASGIGDGKRGFGNGTPNRKYAGIIPYWEYPMMFSSVKGFLPVTTW